MHRILRLPTPTALLVSLLPALAAGGGCGGNGGGEQPELPASVETTAHAATRAAGTTAAFGAPLFETAKGLHMDLPAEGETRWRIEEAVAGNSVVSDPSCVSFDWEGLVASVTFTSCTLELNGAVADGSVSMDVVLQPESSIEIVFEGLVVDGVAVDGTVLVEASGRRDDPWASLSSQLVFEGADGSAEVDLDELSVTTGPHSTAVGGQGHLADDSLETDFTLSALAWERGDCIPSSGSISYTEESQTIAITFLGTTPGTGAVEVQVGSLPPQEAEIFDPC
jgi:hypothetical protein